MNVFISYAAQDENNAKSVCEDIAANGFHCYFAGDSLKQGRAKKEEIRISLDNSSAFVLVLSAASRANDEVLKEIERAIALKLKIFVYKLEDLTLPESLNALLDAPKSYNILDDPDRLHLVEGLLSMSNAPKSSVNAESIQAKITFRRVFKPLLVSILGMAVIIYLSYLIP